MMNLAQVKWSAEYGRSLYSVRATRGEAVEDRIVDETFLVKLFNLVDDVYENVLLMPKEFSLQLGALSARLS
jgi:hypothetical protein